MLIEIFGSEGEAVELDPALGIVKECGVDNSIYFRRRGTHCPGKARG